MLECRICGYKTDRKSNYSRHIKKKCSNKRFSCEYCPKSYKYKSGLSRHLNKCENYKKILNDQHKIVLFSNKNEKDYIEEKKEEKEDNKQINQLLKIIMNQQEKLTETHELLKESLKASGKLADKVGHVNNNISINVHLNNYYKDAMNLTDFIDNISITIEDILYAKNNGSIKGVKKILNDQLTSINPINRPIICSDVNNLQFYIKDDNKWEKDPKHIKINKSLQDIKAKQICKLKEWETKNPLFMNDDKLYKTWEALIFEIVGDGDEETTQKRMNEIKQSLANDTYVDTQLLIKN